jgi:multiple sugar transport system substrate-binding protein
MPDRAKGKSADVERRLNLAVISGAMYDRLYESIPQFERTTGIRVAIRFRGTHPVLNAHLAENSAEPYDLISTHTKYAPSQKPFLAPLEGFDTTDFFPSLLTLATIDGTIYGIPRNIDLRLLHYRTDLMDAPPTTWDELVSVAQALTRPPVLYGFVFTGMESGLFGTFFELVESAGATLFPKSLVPCIDNKQGRWSLHVLRKLIATGAAPKALAGWHYDEVHAYFRQGRAAMVMDWPGYYGSYQETSSMVRGRFRVARMPAGPSGRVCCYAGSHTFALTRGGAEKEEARKLLRFLTHPAQQQIEAQQGSVPVRRSLMEAQKRDASPGDAERLALLSASIESDLIIPPQSSAYPRIEEVLWRNVRATMLDELPIHDALAGMEKQIAECVAHAA